MIRSWKFDQGAKVKFKQSFILSTFILVFASGMGTADEKRIGVIAFFGQEGFDADAICRLLPFREGDTVSLGESEQEASRLRVQWRASSGKAIQQVIGRAPTDVEQVCCTERGEVLVYIGLPGKSYHAIRYNPQAKDAMRLPQSVTKLDDEVGALLMKSGHS